MHKFFSALLLLAIAAPIYAQPRACEEPPQAIRDVRLFDGEAVIARATVVVRCTTIDQVVTGEEQLILPPGSTVIDGEGKTLLPGLIDTHTHAWSVPMLQRPLDFGVTTVMGMGSTNKTFAGEMKAEREQGPARDRADLFAAALWVTAPGSHGTQWAEVPTLVEPEDAADFVQARLDQGADYIKLIYDNFKMFDADIPTLKKETMEAVIAAAHDKGVKAVVHSRDVEAWTDVVNAGVDGIVHLPVDDVPSAALIEQIKVQGIWVGANFSLNRPVGQALIDDPSIGPMLTDAERENLRRFRALHREGGDKVALDTVRALHEAGVTVLPGSDTPNGGTTAGATMHLDLEQMVGTGYSPIEALHAATAGAAAAFGLEDRGRIAEGMQADLLLVEGRPDEQITDTRNIVAVMKAGKLHRRELLTSGEGFIDVEGGRVWYRVVGTGDATPLLLLHGGPGAPSYYLDRLEQVAVDRPVIFYDQLGAGRSPSPSDPALWTVQRFVTELGQVRAALGLDEVHILGHSWGTMLLMDYMLTEPAGVKSLVLASPALSVPRWLADAERQLEAMPEEARAAILKHESEGTTDSQEYQAAVDVYNKLHMCRSDPWPPEMDATFAGFNGELYGYMWGPSEFTATGTLKDYDREAALPGLELPVLFTAGRFDSATPETVQHFQGLVPGAEIQIFENSAHMTMLDEPEAYAEAIRAFLARVDAAAR